MSVTTGSVGVQDLFHYDWTEDTPAEAKGLQRKETEEWLIPLFMFINEPYWEERTVSALVILNFGAWRQTLKRICQCQDCMPVSGEDCCYGAAEYIVYYMIYKDQKMIIVSHLMLFKVCEKVWKYTEEALLNYINMTVLCYAKVAVLDQDLQNNNIDVGEAKKLASFCHLCSQEVYDGLIINP